MTETETKRVDETVKAPRCERVVRSLVQKFKVSLLIVSGRGRSVWLNSSSRPLAYLRQEKPLKQSTTA